MLPFAVKILLLFCQRFIISHPHSPSLHFQVPAPLHLLILIFEFSNFSVFNSPHPGLIYLRLNNKLILPHLCQKPPLYSGER